MNNCKFPEREMAGKGQREAQETGRQESEPS